MVDGEDEISEFASFKSLYVLNEKNGIILSQVNQTSI
jgi:hypothetical protein